MSHTKTPVVAPCPICHYQIAAPFFDGGKQPLATLGWPTSCQTALDMPQLEHKFVQCPTCSHIWNRAFCYEDIPYQDNPNRMFNSGVIWQGHLQETRQLITKILPEGPTVIDIGCGEGHFVRGIAEQNKNKGRFIGFDPNSSPETGYGVEFFSRYFSPLDDMISFKPDIVIMRHVLEHLTAPTAFIDQLAFSAEQQLKGRPCYLFAEVPCIDRVFETGRLSDFFYEHVSHFSTESFTTLMQRAGEVTVLGHGYQKEVVYALVRLSAPNGTVEASEKTASSYQQNAEAKQNITHQLDELYKSGRTVAIWGGTGKAAAFIHQFSADRVRFPIVVDSDPDKAGTYVPKTGQEILFRDYLKTHPAETIIIPTQWRAKDIAQEINREGITYETILIEHMGQLINFETAEHPYL